MSDYAELVQEVVHIAENASRIALQYFRQPILIEMWFSFGGLEDLRETSFVSCSPALKRQILELG